MSNQLQITGGAKVRNLEGVITGTSGVLSSVPLGGANGVATLDSGGKVPVSQLPSSVVTYLGTWNAATNTPTLTNGTGDAGDMYICNVAGTVNFGAGPITFAVGDWVLYGSGTWQKSSGQNGTVTSVAVTESGNALTITGSPITTAGTINIGFAGSSTQYIAGDGTLVTFPTLITEAQNLITDVYNETGATLTKGTVVYINGGHGNLPTVTKAIATVDATSAQTYGVVQADITNNNNGHVVVIGSLGDLDTQAYAAGTQLYLSSTTAGAWTSTKQYAPAHLVYVGIVVRSHPTQGVVEIKIQNGFELDELHNVSAQTPSNGNILQYNSTTSLWTAVAGTTTNIAEGTNLYYTDARSRAAFSETVTGLDYNSTTGVLSTTTGYGIPTTANQTNWTTAYNDSIVSAAVTGTTTKTLTLTQQDGGTVTASWSDYDTAPVTSVFGRTGAVTAQSGDYTTTLVTEGTNLYFTNARAIASTLTGYISGAGTITSADSILSAIQKLNGNISGLVTGVSSVFGRTGAVVAASGDYTTTQVTEGTNLYYTDARARGALSFTAGSGAYNSTTGVITIPTNTNQLTNGASFITLTSLSAGTGISYNNTTGVISSTITQYTDANARAAISLTTTGTSGAATYNSTTGVLNIPNYSETTFGTVTSVGLSSATSGVTIGSSPITTSGVITLAIATASGTQQGLLSSTDWNTFNGKQNTITLTTTGTSGAATLVGSTLNIPQYQAVLTNPVTGTGTTNYLPKFTGTSTIGNSLIYDNGTNVGIGTITPDELLTLNKASSLYARIVNTSNSVSTYWGVNGTEIYFGSSSNSPLTFYTNSSERMRLFSDGNLGLGTTTNAGYKLDVNGTGRFSGNLTSTGQNSFFGQSTSTDSNIYIQAGYDASNKFVTQLRSDYFGAFSIGTTLMPPANSPNTGTYTSRLSFALSGAATFSSSVTANGGLYMPSGGNGTAPTYVYGNSLTYGYNSIGGNAGIYFGNTYNSDYSTAMQFRVVNSGGTNVTAMTLTPSGNVGIGTSSPSAKLHIAQSSSAVLFSESSSVATIIGTNAAGNASQELSLRGFPLTFTGNGGGGAEAMRITSGGAVLIGSTDAAYGTFVAASSNASGYTTASIRNMASGAAFGVQGAQLNFYGDVGYSSGVPTGFIKVISNSGGNNGHGSMSFGTHNGSGSSPEYMRITSGGYVGINVTNPQRYLEVYSATADNHLRLSGNAPSVSMGEAVTGSVFQAKFGLATSSNQFVTGSVGGDFVISNQTGAIIFVRNTTESMRVTSNGYVLIGYSSAPSAAGLLQTTSAYVGSLGTGIVYSLSGVLTSTNPSDLRLKDNVEDLGYGLKEILQLRPVKYNWKNDNANQGKQFGFIAQEVQEVMPELVTTFDTEDGERLGLEKEGIYAALVQAIKEQQAQIEELKALIVAK